MRCYKNWKNFLEKIKELKPYIIKFEDNDAIKPKVYLAHWIIEENNWQSIIIITYDKCTFFANDRICIV